MLFPQLLVLFGDAEEPLGGRALGGSLEVPLKVLVWLWSWSCFLFPGPPYHEQPSQLAGTAFYHDSTMH